MSAATTVVTGGAGFVGSHVCEALLDAGRGVICVDNFSTGSTANVAHLQGRPGFALLDRDVSDGLHLDTDLVTDLDTDLGADLDADLGADPVAGVDQVLHLASPASPPDYLRLPVETLRVGSEGTRHALELAERLGARFLLASTSEVYGDPLEHPQHERYRGNVDPVGPRAVYDEAKRFGEAMTTAFRTARGVDTTIARIFNTYGPRMRPDDGRVVPTFILQALEGRPLTVAGSGQQTRSLCHVSDTVAGLLALAASGHPGPVNIGGTDELTVLEIAGVIRRITGGASDIVHIDLPVGDPRQRRPDISLAREVLGWRPTVNLESGLAETVRWFCQRRDGARR
jgi:dTDP-glucose 4,6-dehydratase